MIGPGGYAELEMDDVALEGGPAHVPSPVHWSQQQVTHVGGSAPLAPVVGSAGFLQTVGPSRLSGMFHGIATQADEVAKHINLPVKFNTFPMNERGSTTCFDGKTL